MSTTAQSLYLSPGAKDFSAPGELSILKLVDIAGASNSTSITAHPNAAGTTSITLYPYTNTSAQSDIRTNAGWAVNRSGSDGMGSSATVPRFIPAGVWTFTLGVTVPVGGTGTGALSVTYAVAVYRVSSAGARALLFTATSAAVTSSSALAGTGYPVATSAAQPEYDLLTGESVEVGYLTTCVQTAGVLGATVAGNIVWAMGDALAYVQVPAPGIRARYASILSDSAPATDTASRQATHVSALSETIGVSDGVARLATCARAAGETVSFTSTLGRTYTSACALTDSAPTTDAVARMLAAGRAVPDSTSVSDAVARLYTGSRAVADTAPATDSVARQLIYTRAVLDALAASIPPVVNNYMRPVLIFEG